MIYANLMKVTNYRESGFHFQLKDRIEIESFFFEFSSAMNFLVDDGRKRIIVES